MESESQLSQIESSEEVDSLCHQLSDFFLKSIWLRMGFSKQALMGRRQTAINILKKTLMDMRAEEEAYLTKIIDRVEKYGKEKTLLAKELGVTPFKIDANLGLIHLEKALRDEVASLRSLKEEKLQEVKKLRREDEDLCSTLEMEPLYVSTKNIPKPSDIDALKHHISEMKALKRDRLAKFCESKLTIITYLEALEEEPQTSFERLIVCENDDALILSDSNLNAVQNYLCRVEERVQQNEAKAKALRRKICNLMEKLNFDSEEIIEVEQNFCGHSPTVIKELEQKLEDLDFIKQERIEDIILSTREELVALWDLCHYSESQRRKFEPYFSTNYSDELLEAHEKEIDSLRKYYEENESLFKMVDKRQELWHKLIELENKKRDPTHLLKAKGKDLIIEEKDRKKVNKLLPKIDEDLRCEMAHYYQTNGKPFLIGGKPLEEFLQEQIAEFELKQEHERRRRQEQKRAENIHETIYGSKSAKPLKRTATVKRKAETPNLDNTKRSRPGVSSYRPSPYSASKAGSKANTNNKSKLGQRVRRKILTENKNQSTFISGPSNQKTQTPDSITSEQFYLDVPKSAVTSTFQTSPESDNTPLRRKSPRLQQQKLQTPDRKDQFHPLTPKTKSSTRLATPRTPGSGFKRWPLVI